METEQTLTFAQAMALDPSEVEVQCQKEQHLWSPLSARYAMTLAHARTLRFRRARPKRSRVQEMAQAKWPPSVQHTHLTFAEMDQEARTETIRAVCEYMVSKCAVMNGAPWNSAIEREFLEPR